MKKIEGYTIDAHENSKKYGEISLSDAIRLFKSFPWADEEIKSKETECFAAVSFGASPLGSRSEYINIYGYESNKYSLMIEAFSKKSLFGFIPIWKYAFMDFDSAPRIMVEEFIMQLYKLNQDDLYDWILDYKKYKHHNAI